MAQVIAHSVRGVLHGATQYTVFSRSSHLSFRGLRACGYVLLWQMSDTETDNASMSCPPCQDPDKVLYTALVILTHAF